jgi:excisionase family DNA binding protein
MEFVRKIREIVEDVSPQTIEPEELSEVVTEFVRGAAKTLMLKSSVQAPKATLSQDDPLMNPKEAAQYIRRSYPGLLQAAKVGEIAGEHPSGHRWAFRRSELDRYLSKQKLRYHR